MCIFFSLLFLLSLFVGVQEIYHSSASTFTSKAEKILFFKEDVLSQAHQIVYEIERVSNQITTTSQNWQEQNGWKVKFFSTVSIKTIFFRSYTNNAITPHVRRYLSFNYPSHNFWWAVFFLAFLINDQV